MPSETTTFRDRFWKSPPELPRGVELYRQDSLVVAQRGPGGQAIYDLAQVRLPQGVVPVLIACRTPLFPADVARLRQRLLQLDEQLRLREASARVLPVPRVPMVATESAGPGVIRACESEDVALVDQRGTMLLRTGSALIRVEGHGALHRRSRAPVFHGKGVRLIRMLLDSVGSAWTARELSMRTQTSYAYVHGVLSQLEQAGFLNRLSRNSGFKVRDPVGLLRAWMQGDEKTAVVTEGFNAPSTAPDALRSGHAHLSAQGIRSIFTLASGLMPEERFVSGVPHGIYLSGSLEPAIHAFGLRRLTPHNFWVLRPQVASETEAGGIYYAPRQLAHGPAVALPQLAVDFQQSGGRGKEQAEFLVEHFAKSLPLAVELA